MTLKALSNATLSSGQLKLYAFEGDDAVGCVELYNYDPVNHRAAVGIVISNEYRHRGYGCEAIKSLASFCRDNTSLHQIYADIAATNTASIRIFQKANFQHCATMHDWVVRGDQYLDTYRFQLSSFLPHFSN